MNKILFLILFSISLFANKMICAQNENISSTYTNPVLNENIGDPFIMQHDGGYYLYGTTSSNDGFKCWSSSNLRDWAYEGFAYKKTNSSWGKKNYWAPEVYFKNGAFYLAYSSSGKSTTGNQMLLCIAKSDSPTGPFTDLYAPWFDPGFSCIDAHLFFDDDDRTYLFFDKVGYEGNWPDGYMYGLIYCMELDKNFQAISDTVLCSKAEQEWENPLSMHSRCNEGCYVFKYNGKYYMTYSANHFEDPFYGIGYSTAPSPMGPWTKNPKNPLIGINEKSKIYGPGHNSFTHSPDGNELFIVYHTHVSEDNKNRQVNIDRVVFDKIGNMKIQGPSRSPQKLPSGVK